MKALYLQGPSPDADASTLRQLSAAAPDLDITTVATPADTLVALRRQSGWEALFVSPAVPETESLPLLASLRRSRVPIAIVPIVDDRNPEQVASATASDVDDVLVRRGEALVHVGDTLERVRQSPHVKPPQPRRRLHLLYAGRDPLVWTLLEQVPFVSAERVLCGADGSLPIREPESAGSTLRVDAVVVDEPPGEATPLQVVRFVKSQSESLPLIALTPASNPDAGPAALEAGADDVVVKTGLFRRRLITLLQRAHERLELAARHDDLRHREERLRAVIEHAPVALGLVTPDGAVAAMNQEGLRLFGATKPREVVGRDVRSLAKAEYHLRFGDLLQRTARGEPSSLTFEADTLDGTKRSLRVRMSAGDQDPAGTRTIIAAFSDLGPIDRESRDDAAVAESRRMAAALEERCRALEAGQTAALTEWLAERESLQARIAEAETEVLRQNATVEITRAERETGSALVQELLSAAEADRERHQADQTVIEGLREELRRATVAHETEREARQQLRADYDRSLKTELDRARSQANAALAELQQRLEGERETALADRTRLETELTDALTRLATLEVIPASLESARREHQSTLESIAVERAAWATERETWSAQRAAWDAERGTWHGERAELDRQRSELESACAAAFELASGRQQAIDALHAETAELRGQQQRLVEAMEALQRELETTVQTLAKERSAHEDQTRELDALQGALGQALAVQAAIEGRAREAAEGAGARIASLEAERMALEEALARQTAQVAVVEQQAAETAAHLERTHADTAASLARLLGSQLVGYVVSTPDGRVVRCNTTFARLVGYPDAAVLLCEHEGPLRALAARGPLDARLQVDRRLPQVESRLLRADGSARPIVQSAEIIDGPDGGPLVERVVIDRALLTADNGGSADRLRELGALAASMAPEIETLAATLQAETTPDRASEIDALWRLYARVRQLAAFSRRQLAAGGTVRLHDLLEGESATLRHLVGDFVDFEVHSSAEVIVSCASHDVRQLLTSLVTFGRDLLPAGGTLTVETSESVLYDEQGIAVTGAVLAVSASGYGVVSPAEAPVLEALASRCGAALRLRGEPGTLARIEVFFPD
jgi:PAS domain S-box-containing protein